MISFLLGLFMTTPTIRDCAPGTSLFLVNSVSLNPSTPMPGEKVSLHLEYTVPTGYVTTAGQAKYEITYNFIPLTPTVEPLCQNIPCPLGAGSYTNNTVSEWPTGLSGTLKTKITWMDIMGVELLCLQMDAKF